MNKQEVLGTELPVPKVQISIIARAKVEYNTYTITRFIADHAEFKLIQLRKAKGELNNVSIYAGPIDNYSFEELQYHWEEGCETAGHAEMDANGVLSQRLNKCTHTGYLSSLDCQLCDASVLQ